MNAPYQDRIFRVIDRIYANPGADLRLDELADMAAMSRFHWPNLSKRGVFRAVNVETLADAVRRIRMGRAATWLISTDWPLLQVARASGYPNPQSFSRTFAETPGLTPVAYRKRGILVPLATPHAPSPQGVDPMLPITIKTLPAHRLAAMAHSGAFPAIGLAFETAGAVFATRKLLPQTKGMMGVYYDDPSAIPEPELHGFAGMIVADDFDIPAPLQEVVVAAGPYAVLTYTGPYAGLPLAYDYLYRTWLPASGHQVGAQPVIELYLNSPADTAPDKLVTEVCLPLA